MSQNEQFDLDAYPQNMNEHEDFLENERYLKMQLQAEQAEFDALHHDHMIREEVKMEYEIYLDSMRQEFLAEKQLLLEALDIQQDPGSRLPGNFD